MIEIFSVNIGWEEGRLVLKFLVVLLAARRDWPFSQGHLSRIADDILQRLAREARIPCSNIPIKLKKLLLLQGGVSSLQPDVHRF